MKTIGILTSSRADYGIYLPLLNLLKKDPDFSLKLIVFGTHLSPFHGYTINNIVEDGFNTNYIIESMVIGDTPNSISTALALTSLKFADFWKDHINEFDLVFCLGDRYEMFAAVTSGIPFNIPFAHIHGGEKTLGAIDDIFRNSITLASKYHFVSCESHRKRVAKLTESQDNIYNIGALSLDSISSLSLLSINDFKERHGLDLSNPTILLTLHPETKHPDNNEAFVNELSLTLLKLKNYQVLITLPNADTFGTIIRNRFLLLPSQSENRIQCFENLGTQSYFTAMKYCSFMIGNTSSGIIEAASFGKWVINVGNRQYGRIHSNNVYNSPFKESSIIKFIKRIEKDPDYKGGNIFFQGNAASLVCSVLKKYL